MRFNTFALICIFLIALSSPVKAQNIDVQTFATLPILHDGRIKPIDSFARIQMKELSGSDKNAIYRLMEIIFDPARAVDKPLLKIGSPDIRNMLELENVKEKNFSFSEVSMALEKKQAIILAAINTPQEKLTQAQKDLILLQRHTAQMKDLLSSLSLALPMSVEISKAAPNFLHPYVERNITYLDAITLQKKLQDSIESLVANKGSDISRHNKGEQEMAKLAFAVAGLKSASEQSFLFRVIPSETAKGEKLWLSPWREIEQESEGTSTDKLLKLWQEMATAYHTQDSNLWNKTSLQIAAETKKPGKESIRTAALHTENLYNLIDPLRLSLLAYGFALATLTGFTFTRRKKLLQTSVFILGTGITLHAAAIIARVFIMLRPPVSTLYESMIFVGLITATYGFIKFTLQKDRQKNTLWLFIAAGSGVLIQILAAANMQTPDSLLMLPAVLNTDFWLATHVICITTGYAFCIISSLLAHYMLIHMIIKRMTTPPKELFQNLHSLLLLALLFSLGGTVLGGIWADQSWGRFWGWDPKENGALLIVLWLLWILHGRISGKINRIMLIIGTAYLSVIVALSWLGVNILGVGLHSYGFTDKAALTLGVFILAETLFSYKCSSILGKTRHEF